MAKNPRLSWSTLISLNSTKNPILTCSKNLAACQNKSPASSSHGPLRPADRLFMQIKLTVTVQLRDGCRMKGGPYLAGIAYWPPGPGDPLWTSNHGHQGPATGHANTGCSLRVRMMSSEFHLGALYSAQLVKGCIVSYENTNILTNK